MNTSSGFVNSEIAKPSRRLDDGLIGSLMGTALMRNPSVEGFLSFESTTGPATGSTFFGRVLWWFCCFGLVINHRSDETSGKLSNLLSTGGSHE